MATSSLNACSYDAGVGAEQTAPPSASFMRGLWDAQWRARHSVNKVAGPRLASLRAELEAEARARHQKDLLVALACVLSSVLIIAAGWVHLRVAAPQLGALSSSVHAYALAVHDSGEAIDELRATHADWLATEAEIEAMELATRATATQAEPERATLSEVTTKPKPKSRRRPGRSKAKAKAKSEPVAPKPSSSPPKRAPISLDIGDDPLAGL